MSISSARHTSDEMIMNHDWPSFFENVVKSHQGQPVAIEQDGNLLLDDPPGEGVPLQGIELRSDHKHDAVIITMEAQTYTVEAPSLIWAVRDEHKELVAVEIIDARDRKFIVRFV